MDENPLKHLWHPEPEEPQTIETMSVQVDWNDWFKHSGLVLRLYYADEQKIQKTNRAHLIKSLLCGELSHENICVDAFRLSTVKKLAEGKPLVQQMPWAAEENAANNRGGGGPNGKVGIWFTVYHCVHSHCGWQISKFYLHETALMFSGTFYTRMSILSFQVWSGKRQTISWNIATSKI